MKNILKKLIYLQIFLFIFSAGLFAQSYNIDYYGIVAQSLDNNMAKMTSDLYYTQLSEISNFTVYDKRTTPSRTSTPDFSSLSTDNLIFYAEIEKDSQEDKWSVIFSVVDKGKNQQYSKSKTYDSFYKILMESKNELRATIKELVEENPELRKIDSNIGDSKGAPGSSSKSGTKITVKSYEDLSGTWKGEKNIDKVVLLRGGRGFVIFDNGASMNVTVAIENNGNSITIQQKGNTNASYFTELPRSIALDAAISAPPIKWTMSLMDNSTMEGIKTTLIPDNSSFKVGSIPVQWEKIN